VIRLLKMLAATAALITTVMVPHLVDGTESVWTLTGYAVGMCVAAGTVVQLTASAAVQWIVSARPKPLTFTPSPKLTPEEVAETEAWLAKHWPNVSRTTGGEVR
jgi:hypothetical protein